MEKTFIISASLLFKMIEGVLRKDPVVISQTVKFFKISDEQIGRTFLPPKQTTNKSLADLHSKKVIQVKNYLRNELARIANEKGLVEVGKPIPTMTKYVLKHISTDGWFIIRDESETRRTSEVVDVFEKTELLQHLKGKIIRE